MFYSVAGQAFVVDGGAKMPRLTTFALEAKSQQEAEAEGLRRLQCETFPMKNGFSDHKVVVEPISSETIDAIQAARPKEVQVVHHHHHFEPRPVL